MYPPFDEEAEERLERVGNLKRARNRFTMAQ